MNSDLDDLIDELQREYDDLKIKMKAYADEWDYISAENSKSALLLVSEKLNALKSIRITNYRKIKSHEANIRNLKKILIQLEKTDKSEAYKSFSRERLQNRLSQLHDELENLTALKHQKYIDSDKLIEAIELVISDNLKRIELCPIEKKISLAFNRIDEVRFRLKIYPTGKYGMNNYLHPRSISILSQLGFLNCEGEYLYDIEESVISPEGILELVSILCFEVFILSGEMEMRMV